MQAISQETPREMLLPWEIEPISASTYLAVGVITAFGVALLAATSMSAFHVVVLTGTFCGIALGIDFVLQNADEFGNAFLAFLQPIMQGAVSQEWNASANTIFDSLEVPFGKRALQDLGYSLPESSQLDMSHISRSDLIDGIIPEAPEGVELFEILTLFQNINFSRAEEPDYISPSEWKNDDDAPLTKEELFDSIETWIVNIEGNKTRVGTPSTTAEKRVYYQNLTKLLKWIAYEFRSLEGIERKNKANRVILDFAIAGTHCGGRVMASALEGYRFAHLNKPNANLEAKILTKLQSFRLGIVDHLARTYNQIFDDITSGSGGEFHPHFITKILHLIGADRELLGHEQAQFNDPNQNILVTYDRAIRDFDRFYTKENIAVQISEGINGTRDLPTRDVSNWFECHRPDAWIDKPDYLSEFVWNEEGSIRSEALFYLLQEINIITN